MKVAIIISEKTSAGAVSGFVHDTLRTAECFNVRISCSCLRSWEVRERCARRRVCHLLGWPERLYAEPIAAREPSARRAEPMIVGLTVGIERG